MITVNTANNLYELLHMHKILRPMMMPQDVYKLIYQGVFGVGHILTSSAWDYLEKESSELNLNDLPSESLTEKVSINGNIIRVNLRPWLKEGHNLQLLYDSMILSKVEGSYKVFIEIWDEFVSLVKMKKIDFNMNEVIVINNELNREKPQTKHHTEVYRKYYKPAYRVLLRKELDKILGV